MAGAKVLDADTPDTFPFGGIREGSAMDALKKLIGVIVFAVGVWLITSVAVDQESVLVQTFHELGFSGWWAGLIFWNTRGRFLVTSYLCLLGTLLFMPLIRSRTQKKEQPNAPQLAGNMLAPRHAGSAVGRLGYGSSLAPAWC